MMQSEQQTFNYTNTAKTLRHSANMPEFKMRTDATSGTSYAVVSLFL